MSKPYKEAAAAISEAFEQAARGMLDGLKEDIRDFAMEIGRRIARAALANRPDLVEELKDQLLMLAEMERVKVVNETNDAINKVIDIIATTAIKLLL